MKFVSRQRYASQSLKD